jgi:hypothetical protein
MTLVEFISARLDETEQQAREDEWVHLAPGWTAYILADVDAKRAILADHEAMPVGDRVFCRRCGEPPQWGFDAGTVEYPCPTLLALTLPYVDHPDYDPAWR